MTEIFKSSFVHLNLSGLRTFEKHLLVINIQKWPVCLRPGYYRPEGRRRYDEQVFLDSLRQCGKWNAAMWCQLPRHLLYCSGYCLKSNLQEEHSDTKWTNVRSQMGETGTDQLMCQRSDRPMCQRWGRHWPNWEKRDKSKLSVVGDTNSLHSLSSSLFSSFLNLSSFALVSGLL